MTMNKTGHMFADVASRDGLYTALTWAADCDYYERYMDGCDEYVADFDEDEETYRDGLAAARWLDSIGLDAETGDLLRYMLMDDYDALFNVLIDKKKFRDVVIASYTSLHKCSVSLDESGWGTCSECGEDVYDTDVYCAHCGAKVEFV